MTGTAVTAGPGSARYPVERTLGRGGMATVYLARDLELERPVALKVIAPHLAGDESVRSRFLREARLAAQVIHPNIVQVYDAGEGEAGPFIVMEYVEGNTLADELRVRGHLPEHEAVQAALQLCAGLEAAHGKRLVHRDVKPQNILRRRDGVLKIADFGIARSLSAARQTEFGAVLGTAAYLAPEQARGEEVTAAADLYSLGVVLYELLTGRLPFPPATIPGLLAGEQPAADPPSEISDDVSPELESIVMHLLARLPEYRPRSAAVLAELLAGAVGGSAHPLPVDFVPAAVEAPAGESPRRDHRTGRRRGLRLMLGLAVLALAAGAAIAYSRGTASTRHQARTTASPGAKRSGAAVTRHDTATAPSTLRTPAEVLAALRSAISAAARDDAIDRPAAADLEYRVGELSSSVGRGSEIEVAHELGDFQSHVSDLATAGQIAPAAEAAVTGLLDRLAELLGVSVGVAPAEPVGPAQHLKPHPRHPDHPRHGSKHEKH